MVAISGEVQPGETLEDLVPAVGWDAGTVVVDGQDRVTVDVGEADAGPSESACDTALSRRLRTSCSSSIGSPVTWAGSTARQSTRTGLSVARWSTTVSTTSSRSTATRVRLRVPSSARASSSSCSASSLHADGLVEQVAADVVPLDGAVTRSRGLELGAEAGDGAAQLVCGVGNEPALAFAAVLQAGEHGVDRARETADLVELGGFEDTAVQVASGDGVGLAPDGLDRRERTTDHGPHRSRQQQHEDRDRGEADLRG